MSKSHEHVRYTHIIGDATQEYLVAGSTSKTLDSAGIALTGISLAREPFEFVRPDWACAQILACVSGTGKVLVNGKWQNCQAGTAYLTPPNKLHAYRAIENDQPWQFAFVTYSAPLRHCPLTVTEPTLIQADTRLLHSAVQGLYRETVDQADPLCINHWIDLLTHYAQRLCCLRSSGRLWPVWEQVRSHLAKNWNVEMMADLAAMSTEHFRRLCHEELGRSPMRHLTRMRLQHSAGLLTNTPLTVDAIAQSVGYADRFGFSQAFKKEFGLSPGQFRKTPKPRE